MKNDWTMKNPIEEKKTPATKIPAVEKDTKDPVFTPPAKPAVKEQKGPDPRDKEVVKDGSEFEVPTTKEMPATPHEHGVSAPSTESGGAASIS
ncbi:MAG: hypothetical protein RLZZ519_2221 [Bacteroidota bacterium]|jgi:hypothetical protein